MDAPLTFWLNDTQHALRDVGPTRTVLEWLREEQRVSGTKEGCAEGDCGACTVVVAELVNDQLRYRAINSCITFLPALDGRQLITVEHLAPASAPLHPVQQALVDHHGSQCGFCTPGFVMSLFALYQDKRQADQRAVTRDEAACALAGNLCRCTGYRPIVDAACTMTRDAWVAPDEALIAQRLRAMARGASLSQRSAVGAFDLPQSLAELLHLRAAHPQARLVGGSTDVGLWVTKQHRALEHLIFTGRVAELQSVVTTTDAIEIGAAVTLTDAVAALDRAFPAAQDYWRRFASPPVRNSGTLGGNVANGSPIGDAMPVLIALGAEVVLASVRGERVLALESFYLGYQQTALAPDEVLRAIRVPRRDGVQLAAYKLSKRADQDISALALAIALLLDGERVVKVRVGVGGMAAVPKRAAATEAALRGRRFDEAALAAAQAALASEFAPIDDLRASAAYRRVAGQNLLRRAWLRLSPLAPRSRAVPLTLAEVAP